MNICLVWDYIIIWYVFYVNQIECKGISSTINTIGINFKGDTWGYSYKSNEGMN